MAVNFLNIKAEVVDEIHVITLSGSVDTGTLEKFKNLLNPLAETDGARIVLDCGDLVYINSSTMGQLVSVQKRLSTRGGRLVVCDVQPKILQVMKLLSLDREVPVCANRKEALQMLA